MLSMDPAELVELILIHFTKNEKFDKVIQSMPKKEYEVLEEDLYDIIEMWKHQPTE